MCKDGDKLKSDPIRLETIGVPAGTPPVTSEDSRLSLFRVDGSLRSSLAASFWVATAM